MCGIFGIAAETPVAAKLFEGLKRLDYRGYDSCGIAVVDQGALAVRKDVGKVAEVGAIHRFAEVPGNLGIGHTRWATHGEVTRANSHPHTCCHERIAIIHNGIISNFLELREALEAQGHTFRSETDSEVLAHLLEHFYAQSHDFEQALVETTRNLKGTYAFAAVTADDPERIYCARQVSPLVIGLGTGETYLGSDINAFIAHTRTIKELQDGEYAVISPRGAVIRNVLTGERVERPLTVVPWSAAMVEKGGYPHYMTKEIHEQPRVVRTALEIPTKTIDSVVDLLLEADKLYLLGVGTTHYVSLIGSYYAARIARRFIPAISSDEFEYLAEVDDTTAVLAFSQSGETYDTLRAMRHARERGARLAAIVNAVGSTMIREVDVSLMQGGGPEISVLSTKAALSQIVIFLRILLRLAERSGRSDAAELQRHTEDLARLPALIQNVLDERKGFINRVARRHARTRNWLMMGRGIYYAVALEAALKLKEAAYQHAEGMQGGFMKHGTIALIDDDMLSAFFMPPPEDAELYEATLHNAQEVKARKGKVVGFHFEETNPLFDEEIRLPACPPLLAPILLLVAGQLFAYYTAVVLKRDVDRPRSLAKAVTVG
jgi:glucosamine--fructose-6-phosphate aminotransferase (isomerizing)